MKKIIKSGFTLVELLIVITILGILASIGLVAFSSAQTRGRDAQRKNDLKEMSHAIELFSQDYSIYPNSDNGLIMACPYDTTVVPAVGTDCAWGSGVLQDVRKIGSTSTNTLYLKQVPKDPSSSYKYYYRIVPKSGGGTPDYLHYQIFAHLENTQDINCLPDNTGAPNCASPDVPAGIDCGGVCNFAVTSANSKASDSTSN